MREGVQQPLHVATKVIGGLDKSDTSLVSVIVMIN